MKNHNLQSFNRIINNNNSEGSSAIGTSLFLHSKILNGRYIASDQGSTATVSIELRYYFQWQQCFSPVPSALNRTPRRKEIRWKRIKK